MRKVATIFLSLILIVLLCSQAYTDIYAFRKYPYLIHGGYKVDKDGKKKPSMMVLWHASDDNTATIEFGNKDVSGNITYGSPISIQGKGCCEREGQKGGCTCKDLTVKGYLFQYTKDYLTPGSVTYYRVELSKGEQFYSSFMAAPDDASTNLVFYGLGDTRTDTDEKPGNYEAVVSELWKDVSANRTVRNTLCIHDGDFVIDGQNYERQTKGKDSDRDLWDTTFFNPDQISGYRQDVVKFLGSMPLMGVAGNHEGYYHTPKGTHTDYANFGKRFKAYFPYPQYQEYTSSPSANCSSGNCFYYSFDYGPVHFIMVDVNKRDKFNPNKEAGDNEKYASLSPHPQNQGQYEWLKDDIKNSTKPWNIIVLHNPLYSASGLRDRFDSANGGDATIRDGLHQLLAKDPDIGGKVKLVIQGHDHFYARAVVDKITYLTLGTGGANDAGKATPIGAAYRPPSTAHPEVQAAYDNNCGPGNNLPCFHFARFEIADSSMNVTVTYAGKDVSGNIEAPFSIGLTK